MRAELSGLGMRVESRSKLIGESGAEHVADITATGPDGRKFIVDVIISHDLVNEEPVISTYAKVLDTTPTETFLLVMPKATAVARELAESYKIKLVEGISADELSANFVKALNLLTV